MQRALTRPFLIFLSLMMVLILIGCGITTTQTGTTPSPEGANSKPEPAFDAVNHFKGKRITLVVPWGPGGAVDLFARNTAPFLARHIPGNPTVLVENKAGGSGVTASNSFFKTAKPDGMTLLVTSASAETSQLMREQSSAEYDLNQMPVAGAAGDTNIFYASTAKIKSAKDLKSVASLFVAVRGPTSTSTIDLLHGIGLFRSDFKAIQYPGGTSEARSRLYSGEVDVFSEFATNYFESVEPETKNGLVVPLWQSGLLVNGQIVRDDRAKDIPTIVEVYELVNGKPMSADQMEISKLVAGFNSMNTYAMVPPNTPQPIFDALTEAFRKSFADPEFQKLTMLNGTPRATLDAQTAREARKIVLGTPQAAIDKHMKIWNEVTK